LDASAPPATSPLSLHDALPIYLTAEQKSASGIVSGNGEGPNELATPDISGARSASSACCTPGTKSSSFILTCTASFPPADSRSRSEEHTSELQSRGHLVCRLLL